VAAPCVRANECTDVMRLILDPTPNV